MQGCNVILCIFTLKKTRASGRNVGKVFNPVVKLVLENQPFLMSEPAEKPSLQCYRPLVSWEQYLITCTVCLEKSSQFN